MGWPALRPPAAPLGRGCDLGIFGQVYADLLVEDAVQPDQVFTRARNLSSDGTMYQGAFGTSLDKIGPSAYLAPRSGARFRGRSSRPAAGIRIARWPGRPEFVPISRTPLRRPFRGVATAVRVSDGW